MEPAAGRLLVVAATHSAPMRAFVASAFGNDSGEPDHLEQIRILVEDDRAVVRFRDHRVRMHVPARLPSWM